MERTSSFPFPANYVTLKDLQERWIKRKQDEENEAKLRMLRAEEETKKTQNEPEEKNHQPKSKYRTGFAKKSHSSSTVPYSHSQWQAKGGGGERKQRNLANDWKAKKTNEFNANEGKASEKAIDAKSETSTVIAGRGKSKKRQSPRSRIPASESDSKVEIAGKRKEEEQNEFQKANEEKASAAKSETSTAIAGRRRSKNRQFARYRIPASESDSMVEIAGNRKEEKQQEFHKANEFNANEEKAREAKSETSTAISGRRRPNNRQSARSRIPGSQSDSVVEIAGERKEELKGFQIARKDRTEEICGKVGDLSISNGGNRRGGRISRGGDGRRRRGGGTVRVSAPAAGMVWVRKTKEG